MKNNDNLNENKKAELGTFKEILNALFAGEVVRLTFLNGVYYQNFKSRLSTIKSLVKNEFIAECPDIPLDGLPFNKHLTYEVAQLGNGELDVKISLAEPTKGKLFSFQILSPSTQIPDESEASK